MSMSTHWDKIYATKQPTEVSWYQVEPHESLDLIRRLSESKSVHIINVGGGASTLVDYLLADGFAHVTVLDISATALDVARTRLGDSKQIVTWIAANITTADLPANHFDIWHDRAVFHFLTRTEDRRRYVKKMSRALKPGGYAIMATFALDGPTQCSGLEVMRYSPQALQAELGEGFSLLESYHATHTTPFGSHQSFIYCVFKRSSDR